ncbi:MAG: hypothetical protein H6579_06725 [Chitinophagales bacterium]|nr:hypothetical protein [Chitinophagales bacterium]
MRPIILMYSLLLSLLLLYSCRDKSTKKEINLEAYMEILETLDSCSIYDPNSKISYTPENTRIYFLGQTEGASLVLIESEKTCGYAGSCGNRCMVIKDKSELVFQDCAYVEEISDSLSEGIAIFFLSHRGYQTGTLISEITWTGYSFTSTKVSRNDIPFSVLLQVPLDKEACVETNFDCYDIEQLQIEKLVIGNHEEQGLLVSAPYYIFDRSIDGREYYLFKQVGRNDYSLLKVFHNTTEISFSKSEESYYKIITTETDSITLLSVQKEYIWQNEGYEERIIFAP